MHNLSYHYVIEFDFQDNERARKTHFHMEGQKLFLDFFNIHVDYVRCLCYIFNPHGSRVHLLMRIADTACSTILATASIWIVYD